MKSMEKMFKSGSCKFSHNDYDFNRLVEMLFVLGNPKNEWHVSINDGVYRRADTFKTRMILPTVTTKITCDLHQQVSLLFKGTT